MPVEGILSGMERTGPGLRRRYIGKTLRALRLDCGLSSTAVAKQLGISQPHLSRIEGGRCAIDPRHVVRLLSIYGDDDPANNRLVALCTAAEAAGWWEQFDDIINDHFATFASLEADASEALAYESEFVPGLFQTAAYVRALRLASRPDATEAHLTRSVELRMTRQRHMPGAIHAVVNEAVVRRRVGTPEAMREQIVTLRDRAEAGALQVLPFECGPHPAMNGAFTILRFADAVDMDLVYIDTERGGMYVEKAQDIERYEIIFTRLREMALSTNESAALLDTLWR